MRVFTHLRNAAAIAVLAAGIWAWQPVAAAPYVVQGPFATPAAGTILPSPTVVSGKEYSHWLDVQTPGGAPPIWDAEQVVRWDGIGGTEDGFDYTGSRPMDPFDGEVDALANAGDALFPEVIANQAFLIFSVSQDPNIYWEGMAPGSFGLWAGPADINVFGVLDVDGLEVWGEEPPDSGDANRYSLAGDPFEDTVTPLPPKVAVWEFDGVGSYPVFYTMDLSESIEMQFGIPGLKDQLVEVLDVDAMMTSGGSILFSVAPLSVPSPLGGTFDLDGGEIFVLDGVGQATYFLDHGGHLWDTAFDVMGTFGLLSENINALEAVSTPEPSTALLLVLAGGAMLRRRPTLTRRRTDVD